MAGLETGFLGKLKNNENNNFRHYYILSAYEVIDETSTNRTYVSLIFYHIVRSKKYLSKKNYRFFFQKGIVLCGFHQNTLGPVGVKDALNE